MVIIDGYEGVFNNASGSEAFINNIIKRYVLPLQWCDLVVSARCAATLVNLTQYCNKYEVHGVEILGFTEELQQQYLKCNTGSENVDVLTDYCNSKPIGRSLCHHPLFIKFLVFLYKRSKSFSTFQTELINKFACIMILWVLQCQQECSDVDVTVSTLFKTLPDKC